MKASIEQFIAGARWFGGKGRGFEVSDVREIPLREDLRIALATVTFDGGETATYQLPIAYYNKPQEHLDHALIGTWIDPQLGEVFGYDALHDHGMTPFLLQAFATATTYDGLVFHRVGDHDIDTEARSAVLSAEQSNTSVAFGEDSLLKVFRRVTPGRNPDIEVHERLTEAGVENIAALYGWAELQDGPGPPYQLAMLQQFLRTASDGWELALTSVRDLFASPDVSAPDAGGDFEAEAHRLGNAVAEIHLALASGFATGTLSPDDIADGMAARLDAAVAIAPALQRHASALRARFDDLRSIDGEVPCQRVHGDLHLGQTLRTVKGWKIVDFEGEPAKTLAERVLPDSAWRDVAGMLRSFDYASQTIEEAPTEAGEHSASRAHEWADRNRSGFLDGYREVTGEDARSGSAATLVSAYEADKAVYEVVYETRHRPDWVRIPLDAIQRLTA
jgi:maltokinase